jgi:hypothetical protein
MNLFDMARRGDPTLTIGPSTTLAKWVADDQTVWRSLRIQHDPTPQVHVHHVTKWHPFFHRPESVGWQVRTLKGFGRLRVQLLTPQGPVGQHDLSIDTTPICAYSVAAGN